ncbi:putative glutamate--cysteine ligase 2-3 [Actinoplanes sp. OR16]|uniref:carboxylate-amine ligase n=1 Tax=Actinoplanes sp. OR16 TaxID=946334 RepID=UPI000F6D6D8E|nr:YbdK family carboxylate-amine ligase [Actinoplanes sp. OR16]BBH69732.1 putative glutamate--cysteine ligase 2-3 [Actinoplanes sp. OR16]
MTSMITAGSAARRAGPRALTVGVEEEFLLVDPVTGRNLPVGDQVRDALPAEVRANSRSEFRPSMIELVTGVCTDVEDVRGQLVAARFATAGVARSADARLVAIGATPVAEADRGIPAVPRFQAITDRFGPVARDPAVCGQHVHVGVDDRDLAVRVCDWLRPWLPVIHALTGNSPLFEGADTGYASWRSAQLLRWPGMGPTPHFGSAREYDRTVADLIATGAALDQGMIFWYARLSPTYPTVEVRVGDACTDVDDAVLVTALIRAAVATAIAEIESGTPAIPLPRQEEQQQEEEQRPDEQQPGELRQPGEQHQPGELRRPGDLRDSVVAAAHWRAARDGCSGDLADLRTARLRPAWQLIGDLFTTVEPALRASGDLDLVTAGLDRVRRTGDGATRQRAILASTGDIRAVLATLAAWTCAA